MRQLIWVVAALAAGCGGSDGKGPSPSGTGGSDSAIGSSAGTGGPSAMAASGGAMAQMPGTGGMGMVAPPDSDTLDASDAAQPDATVVEAPDLSIEIYDPERVPLFEIDMPQASFDALEADPDTYVRATLHYGDETVTDIGIRIKGEGSKRKLTEKAAFKIKFDEFVDDQSFHGLRRLTLNNMVEDPSFIAERLAYDVFRAAGLPAPRCNSAQVRVNGMDYGVYANVETEDKTFLRRWFDDDDGNLYEEGQTDFWADSVDKFDLETNETENDRSDLLALLAAIETSTPSTYEADVGAELDMKHFLRFAAAEAAVNQWDMYAYTVIHPNNFRIYRDPTIGKFVFLPSGMDMSMKPFPATGTEFIAVMDLAHAGALPNEVVSAGVMFRLCFESPACKANYVKAVEEIIEQFDELDVPALAERYYEQIKDLVYMDPRKERSNEEFESSYQTVLDIVERRTAEMRSDLQD